MSYYHELKENQFKDSSYTSIRQNRPLKRVEASVSKLSASNEAE